ncbi:PTS sugar transporter subunit IIA [Companilactobacillus zhachilii]|jgi:Phosphotransferase system, mannose/fructose-specific component IIA|uniref:PTS sugar transporter subunit IIA n=1 Tax=Companilactobacillus zhachilii TaxID=2304606 RepID=A0A386PX51_9LACO|nr:PTS sugar transporter subunit IIA [Companilactobacillus zhachilii]AYE39130.1 PTS sugar transporter subunit IIA [Companilactobacillus zhachilii]
MKIVLISHSNMAVGMKQTLNMIIGDDKNVLAFAAYVNGSTKEIDKVKNLVETSKDEQFIILTDLLGGSVNNEMMQLLENNTNVKLVTGMNLPLAMQLQLKGSTTEKISDEELSTVISESKKSLANVKNLLMEKEKSENDQIL